MYSLTYDFDELPLLRANGLGTIHASGRVELCFGDDGDWTLDRIFLDALGIGPGPLRRGTIEIPHGGVWWMHLDAALETLREDIDAKVAEYLWPARSRSPNREHRLVYRDVSPVVPFERRA